MAEPLFGEVLYNPTALIVAALSSSNVYGTPVEVTRFDTVDWDYEAMNDELMSAGLITDLLSIITKLTGTIKEASINRAALTVLTGDTSSGSGTTPNQVNTMDFKVGGAGLPYFGCIVRFEALYGANVLVGMPKCKLDSMPAFAVEQNAFRRGEASFSAIAAGTTSNSPIRLRSHETAAAIPISQVNFQAFFAGMFS